MEATDSNSIQVYVKAKGEMDACLAHRKHAGCSVCIDYPGCPIWEIYVAAWRLIRREAMLP
jgi:hypothetical protein